MTRMLDRSMARHLHGLIVQRHGYSHGVIMFFGGASVVGASIH